jgi:hypothetical protein
MVEEIIGRLPSLTEAQISHLEDELRRERERRASAAGGGGEDASRVQEGAAPPVTEVLEYRPYEDGYLQLELRRYVRHDGSAHERGPYWYFQFHEGGKRKKLYLGKTSDQESTLAQSGPGPRGSRLLPWPGFAPRTLSVSLGRLAYLYSTQRTPDCLRYAENPIDKPNHRTHQHGLERAGANL